MKRNPNMFTSVPTLRISRSRQDLSHGNKTSMSVGKLYPVDLIEVLPGDTFKQKTNLVARVSSAFLRPVMDNCFIDLYSFFVPGRILYNRYEETFHENKQGSWAQLNPPDLPVITSSTTDLGVISEKTVGDYLGLPIGVQTANKGINILPFRAFALIWNEWFRNENVVDSMNIQQGEFSSIAEMPNNNPWTAGNYTGQLPYVSKKKDYFTSCLPAPQKGDPVTFSLAGNAPLVGRARLYSLDGGASDDLPVVYGNPGNGVPAASVSMYNSQQVALNGALGVENGVVGVGSNTTFDSDVRAYTYPYVRGSTAYANLSEGPANDPAPYVDLSQVSFFNVNDVRLAFALQKMLEEDARGGTRYSEYLAGHYGVYAQDSRLQRPEFLGGRRIPINVQQVAQTNTQDENGEGEVESPLASLGGYSLTNGKTRWTKSFVEHGYVLTVACIRQIHSYSQGIDRLWTRKKREDFYDPKFANLGEQPVYTYQLYGQTSSMNEIFGYNEAGAEYRFLPDKITGEMRPQAQNSLDIWHFGDNYSSAPTLTPDFVNETPIYVDRTLAVPSTSRDQFIVDFWFDISAYRPMPVRSYPGFVDHH